MAENLKSKLKADPVFYISLVGTDPLTGVDEDVYIFDLYTQFYEFFGTDVKVISSQDLWQFYEKDNPTSKKKDVNVYVLLEYFVEHHSTGHFIIDECPFLLDLESKYTISRTKIAVSSKFKHLICYKTCSW